MGNREEIMIDETEEEFIDRMTEEQERMELLRGWRRLPDNKPPWETWKRMVGQFHNEALAWDKWIGIVKKKDLESVYRTTE